MKPLWTRLLPAFAKSVLPEIWDAIQNGEKEKAAYLAGLAATRVAESKAARAMLDEMAERRHAKD